jgi:hypothetical protein
MIELKPWNENVLEFEREHQPKPRVGSLWENTTDGSFGDRVYILAQVDSTHSPHVLLYAMIGLSTGNRYSDPCSWATVLQHLKETDWQPVNWVTITSKERGT